MAQASFKECTQRPELSLMERTCALWHVLIFAAIAGSCTSSHFHFWNLAKVMVSMFQCLSIKDRTILDTLGMMLRCYSIIMHVNARIRLIGFMVITCFCYQTWCCASVWGSHSPPSQGKAWIWHLGKTWRCEGDFSRLQSCPTLQGHVYHIPSGNFSHRS